MERPDVNEVERLVKELRKETGIDFQQGHDCPKLVILDGPDIQKLLSLIKKLKAFQRSVDYALNSGNGSYRP